MIKTAENFVRKSSARVSDEKSKAGSVNFLNTIHIAAIVSRKIREVMVSDTAKRAFPSIDGLKQ